MSKISLTPNASGTGTFTIASPNGNTNRTLTLPDADGALLSDTSSLSSSNLTGALPAIDGSALTGISTTPSTSDVLSATAGASSGAVGTYAWLIHNTANVSWSDGQSIAGSSLRKTTISRDGNATNSPFRAGSYNGTPSGTWMALTTQYGQANYYPAGLFLRIS